MNRAAGAPSITSWSKVRVRWAISCSTSWPSARWGRVVMPPMVTARVPAPGASPQPAVLVPIPRLLNPGDAELKRPVDAAAHPPHQQRDHKCGYQFQPPLADDRLGW